jgi:hypothetical protein
MISSLLHNKFFILIIIIVVAGGAWYGLSSSSGPTPVLTSSAPDTTGDSSIVSTLLALQAITLSGTVLSNPAFTSLKDYTTQIVAEPVGRNDPFAPLSVVSAVNPNATTTKSAKIFQAAH